MSFNNYDASIDVQVGELNLNGSHNHIFDKVELNTSPGALLDFNGTFAFNDSLYGSSLGEINFYGTAASTGNTYFDISDEGWVWRTGTLEGGGTYENVGNFWCRATSGKTLNGASTLLNSGQMTFENVSITLNLSNNSLLENGLGGVLTILSSSGTGIYQSGLGGTFDNNGTLDIQSGGTYVIFSFFQKLR